jgi:hypothetical protein
MKAYHFREVVTGTMTSRSSCLLWLARQNLGNVISVDRAYDVRIPGPTRRSESLSDYGHDNDVGWRNGQIDDSRTTSVRCHEQCIVLARR